jgi:hypothetical protein
VSRDRAVGIATSYELEGLEFGVRVTVSARFLSSPRHPRLFLGSSQSPVQWVPGTISSGLKLPGREGNHSQLQLRSRRRVLIS